MARHSPPQRNSVPHVRIEDRGLDIVTVVFRDELDLLALQARSFDRFLDPGFTGKIIVIVNDVRCAQVMARIKRDVLAQYGRWRGHVDIVPFHTLAHRLDPANGWIVQQVLKLACAERISRPHYVVFDAKNHLVAPTSAAQFVDADGMARQPFEEDDRNLLDHDRTCARYFGLDPADPTRLRFAVQTPFVLHTQTVRNLVRHIETREAATLSDFFCERRFLSEFLLYGAYLESRGDGIRERYRDTPCQTVTMWDNGCRTVDQSLRDVDGWDAFCFGLHRRAAATLDTEDLAKLTRFWRSLRLLGPEETLAGLSRGAREIARKPYLRRTIGFGLGAMTAIGAAATVFRDVPYADATGFTLAAVALVIAAMRAPGRLANALLVSASLAMVAGLGAGMIGFMAHDTRVNGEGDLIEKVGPLGWELRPGSHHVVKTVNGRIINDVVYDIDTKGRRVTTGDGPMTVAFLGDSFTFGEGVGDADTLPQAFADVMGRKLRVLNYGVPAYSPAQVLRALQSGLYEPDIAGAKTLFMLTASWHADRVACKDDWVTGAPRYVTNAGKLVSDGQCPTLPKPTGLTAMVHATAAYQALFAWRLPSVDDDDIVNYINVVSEAVHVARERYGASLKLLYLRNAGYLRYTSFSDDDIIARLRKGGADVLEMTLPHEGKAGVAIPGDGHPNGIGNRMRARMLLKALASEGSPLLLPAKGEPDSRVAH